MAADRCRRFVGEHLRNWDVGKKSRFPILISIPISILDPCLVLVHIPLRFTQQVYDTGVCGCDVCVCADGGAAGRTGRHNLKT